LASDLSNIIKDDISSTLESLLSVDAKIASTKLVSGDDLKSQQCIVVDVDFTFASFDTVKFNFYIPTLASAKFEFLMLGGIGELKNALDEEIIDAINEIVSNICGSIATNTTAQAFKDLGGAKFVINSAKIIQCEDNKALDTTYKFDIKLGDDDISIFIDFNSKFIPYLSYIVTGKQSSSQEQQSLVTSANPLAPAENTNEIVGLIGNESVENLKLLFDVKFKLSIRLGVKVLLLKDILNWDTGTIIELEQMVNEPLDILANGVKIGEGEAVIVEGRFGVKIRHIGIKKLDY
jgi:flagellar motor switch protein FliN/FliY